LSFPEFLRVNPEAEKLVRDSIDFLLTIRKPNGNFPSSMESSGAKDLVHWCHGAGGVVFLLAKAFTHFKDSKYLDACVRCSDLAWSKGLLRKGPGICHGVAGNGYVHLLLFRLTKDVKYLYRASRFAEFLNTDEFMKNARTPDSPFSLFEGLAGTVCFVADLLSPDDAEYPLFPAF
jgi:hypothetical protein